MLDITRKRVLMVVFDSPGGAGFWEGSIVPSSWTLKAVPPHRVEQSKKAKHHLSFLMHASGEKKESLTRH